jgi:hypothetical protein
MSMRSLRERLPRKFPIGIQNCFVEGIPADLLFYPFPPPTFQFGTAMMPLVRFFLG